MLKHLNRVTDHLRGRLRKKGIDFNPYDNVTRERIAEGLLRQNMHREPLGSVHRSRMLLDMIEEGFPTETLASAYFENLDSLLKSRQPRQVDGQIVLGVGTGRCGSTSLVEVLATVEESCCTHENPALISWVPQQSEIDFHMRRFERLSKYFSLVADVSHWWINVLEEVFDNFPDAKVVGLLRDVDSCVKSFMQIKGFGRGSYNHWVPYGNGIWAAAQWDPTYPTYAVPDGCGSDPDAAKSGLIARYVREYNEKLRFIASRAPGRVLLVRTEELNSASALASIFDFIGRNGQVTGIQRNVGTTVDGRNPKFRF